MQAEELIKLAFEARVHSYSPYSKYCVGAALLTEDGSVYLGCNVENASYGGSICAERSAALKAVYDDKRVFIAIAVVGFSSEVKIEEIGYAYPCGICRQFLREFAAPEMKVYVARSETDFLDTTLAALLPNSFGPEALQL